VSGMSKATVIPAASLCDAARRTGIVSGMSKATVIVRFPAAAGAS